VQLLFIVTDFYPPTLVSQ